MTRGDIVMTIEGSLIVVIKATEKQVRGRQIPSYAMVGRQATLKALAQEQLALVGRQYSYSVFHRDTLLPYTPDGLRAIQDHQARVNRTSQQFANELTTLTAPLHQRHDVALKALREEKAALIARLSEGEP